jgi:hypothetical protein
MSGKRSCCIEVDEDRLGTRNGDDMSPMEAFSQKGSFTRPPSILSFGTEPGVIFPIIALRFIALHSREYSNIPSLLCIATLAAD